MRKILQFILLVACCITTVSAQDEFDKNNFYVGYSNNQVDVSENDVDENEDLEDFFEGREGFNGFNVSYTRNVSRFVGLKGDYAYHRKTFEIADGNSTLRLKSNLHNFVGGVQFKDNSNEKRFKPFAHVMAGVARSSVKFSNSLDTDLSDFDDSTTGVSFVVGGGIDFRVSRRVDIRAIQLDYNPTHLGGDFQHNFRIGVGIVIR